MSAFAHLTDTVERIGCEQFFTLEERPKGLNMREDRLFWLWARRTDSDYFGFRMICRLMMA